MDGYIANFCGERGCYAASKDLAAASMPILGVLGATAAVATTMYGIGKYCLGRLDLSLAAQRQAQDLSSREMRAHRQDQAIETQTSSLFTIALSATAMAVIIFATLPKLGALAGLILMGAVGCGAVALTQIVHDRLAQHDGRPHLFAE